MRTFAAILDRVDEGIINRTRSIRGFSSIAVASAADGVKLTVRLAASDSILSDLMRVLTSNGALVRDFRPIEAQPVEVFRSVVGLNRDA